MVRLTAEGAAGRGRRWMLGREQASAVGGEEEQCSHTRQSRFIYVLQIYSIISLNLPLASLGPLFGFFFNQSVSLSATHP